MATRLGFTITIPRLYSAPSRKPFISSSSSTSPSCSFLQSSASRVHPFCFHGGKLPVQRKLLFLSPKATTDQPGFCSFVSSTFLYSFYDSLSLWLKQSKECLSEHQWYEINLFLILLLLFFFWKFYWFSQVRLKMMKFRTVILCPIAT